MSGILYGVGVGPGDPGLITLKAIEIIKKADCIGIPKLPKEESRAYKIAAASIPEMESKEVVAFDFPMAPSVEDEHDRVYGEVRELLKAEKSVALLTIGDPAIYSTALYILERAQREGFPTEIVSGVTSFSDVAARLGISLCEGDEDLHILSGQSPDIIENLKLPGTKVIMKCGKRIGEIKKALMDLETQASTGGAKTGQAKKEIKVYAVSDVGLPAEKRFDGAENIPEDSGYMTTVVVKG